MVELWRGEQRENHRLILPYLEFLISSKTREFPELQLNAGHLGHSAVGRPAGRVRGAPADVHIRIRDLGRGLERWHEPVPNVFLKKTQEHRTKQQTKPKMIIHTHAHPFRLHFTKQTEKERTAA